MDTDTALAVPSNDADVVALAARVRSIEESAAAIVVADEATAAHASDWLADVAGARKSADERRQFFVRPLNDHVKAINALFKRMIDPLETAERVVKEKLLAWRRDEAARIERERRTAEDAQRRADEEARRAREAAEAAQAAASAPDVDAEAASLAAFAAQQRAAEAARVAAQQRAPAKTLDTGTSRVTARKLWKFEVVEPAAVPRAYMCVDDAAVRKAIIDGVHEIAGLRIWQEESIAAGRAR